jgi:uncharacterized protein (TIGR02300 family)
LQADFHGALMKAHRLGPFCRLTRRSLPRYRRRTKEQREVTKPELGSKRRCQKCGAKFFDLNKDPIICPKCRTLFQHAGRAQSAAAKDQDDKEKAIRSVKIDRASQDQVETFDDKVVEPAANDTAIEGDAPVVPFVEQEDEDDDIAALIDGGIGTDE